MPFACHLVVENVKSGLIDLLLFSVFVDITPGQLFAEAENAPHFHWYLIFMAAF
jgi:hypothetical protein